MRLHVIERHVYVCAASACANVYVSECVCVCNKAFHIYVCVHLCKRVTVRLYISQYLCVCISERVCISANMLQAHM